MSARPALTLRLLLVLLLALAGAVTARPGPATSSVEQLALERFLLAGGSMADICADSGRPGRMHDCDRCCLSAPNGLDVRPASLAPTSARAVLAQDTGPVIEAVLQPRWPDAIGRAPPIRA